MVPSFPLSLLCPSYVPKMSLPGNGVLLWFLESVKLTGRQLLTSSQRETDAWWRGRTWASRSMTRTSMATTTKSGEGAPLPVHATCEFPPKVPLDALYEHSNDSKGTQRRFSRRFSTLSRARWQQDVRLGQVWRR